MDKVTDVFNSLYSAVVQAQKEVEGKYIENIDKSYFENGKPKTIKVELGGKQVEVPLFSLVPHNALKIAECEINFEIDLNFNKEVVS